MRIAIMQPYFFPYLGYFQLIDAVDIFVFFDDVNFIKKGWINRNRILMNKTDGFFSIPLLQASQNKLIHEIKIGMDHKWKGKFYRTLEQNYGKAPFYSETKQLVTEVLESDHSNIGALAAHSVIATCHFLEMDVNFKVSSNTFSASKGQERTERILSICKELEVDHYVNPAGGTELYSNMDFEAEGIALSFINNALTPYVQFETSFIPGLSIIDVLMFNPKEEVRSLITQYKLT